MLLDKGPQYTGGPLHKDPKLVTPQLNTTSPWMDVLWYFCVFVLFPQSLGTGNWMSPQPRQGNSQRNSYRGDVLAQDCHKDAHGHLQGPRKDYGVGHKHLFQPQDDYTWKDP